MAIVTRYKKEVPKFEAHSFVGAQGHRPLQGVRTFETSAPLFQSLCLTISERRDR